MLGRDHVCLSATSAAIGSGGSAAEWVSAMPNEGPLFIDCGHGIKRKAAVICRHLLATDGSPVGFVENSSDPDDLQAWCAACEAVFLQEGDMTDTFKAFHQMALVCDACYSECKARHSQYRH